jgi:hypothetical protein
MLPHPKILLAIGTDASSFPAKMQDAPLLMGIEHKMTRNNNNNLLGRETFLHYAFS